MIQLHGILTTALPKTEELPALIPSSWLDAWQRRHGTLTTHHNEQAVRQSLGGLWLLYRSGHVGELYYNAMGRPCFCHQPQIDFNLSHSHTLVCCAFSQDTHPRVGVDAEDLSRVSSFNCLAIAQRWFTENESKLLTAQPSPQQFLRIWTRKEALIKFHGQALASMRSVDTVLAEQEENIQFTEYTVGDTWITLCHQSTAAVPSTLHLITDPATEPPRTTEE